MKDKEEDKDKRQQDTRTRSGLTYRRTRTMISTTVKDLKYLLPLPASCNRSAETNRRISTAVRGEYPLEINPPEKNPQTVTPGDEPPG